MYIDINLSNDALIFRDGCNNSEMKSDSILAALKAMVERGYGYRLHESIVLLLTTLP